ncbi:hypothetical protein GYMLUDRAFT_247681 [Collybiopsis luxurians FD-317 M1]|uniref:Uncharacterized protein n=1 Tax=Collybiopsis luxurians FD-317 M1 TaxID=944289 RepID=A0A0D0C2U9_9AGAR|nr:hypothetical protein GYMLUDRAFT_247681 [Collybiopsis luxurians FD-317 M1]
MLDQFGSSFYMVISLSFVPFTSPSSAETLECLPPEPHGVPLDVQIEVIGYVAFLRPDMDELELNEARAREEAQDRIAEAEKILVRVKDCSGVVERWLSLNQVDAEHLSKFTQGEYTDVKFSGVECIIQSRKSVFGDQYLVIIESDGCILRSWRPWYLIPYPILARWWDSGACFRVLGYRGGGIDDVTQTEIDDAEEILVGVERGEYAREFWADPADVSLEEIDDFKQLDADDTLDIKYAVTRVIDERAHARGLGTEYLALVGHRGSHYASIKLATSIPYPVWNPQGIPQAEGTTQNAG